MKFGSFPIFFVMFFIIFASVSSAQNIGVSPGKIELGKVEVGSTKLVNFYIITPSEETILVKLESERVILNADTVTVNSSEEDIRAWIKIINNPVELKPVDEAIRTIGGLIKGQREVSFLMEVPEDAEPGQHVVNIKPMPVSTGGTIGSVGSRVIAITSVRVLLDIIGNAIRKGVILDVEAGNHINNRLEINTYFQNTGTVTINTVGTQKIYDKNGDLIKEISIGNGYIKPKEIMTFKGVLPTQGLPLEDYNVYTVIDYKTGKAEKSSVFKLTPPTALAVAYEEVISMPLLLIIIIIIVIISVIIYRRVQ